MSEIAAQRTENGLDEDVYQCYLSALLAGNRMQCAGLAEQPQQKLPVKTLYIQLFQRALYQVGELWERNKISVAKEHLATSITESLLNRSYEKIISPKRSGKKVVVSSVEHELHQVGGKMVANIFEIHGWDGFYLGANTPTAELLRFLDEIQPDALGLSLSVYFHLHDLDNMLRSIRAMYEGLPILIGGQAFRFGGEALADAYPLVRYIASLDDLEEWIRQHNS